MSFLVYLFLIKFVESLALCYANIRQVVAVSRWNRVPADMQFSFTPSRLEESKDKAKITVVYNIAVILVDFTLYSIAVLNPQFFKWLWDLSTDPRDMDELFSFQPSLFAMSVTTSYWATRETIVAVLRHRVLKRKPLNLNGVRTVVAEVARGYGKSALRVTVSSLVVQSVVNHYDSSSSLVLVGASFVYFVGRLFLSGPFLHEPDDQVFESLPVSRLKTRLLSLAAVFGVSPAQVMLSDTYDWRMDLDTEESEARGRIMSLVATYYREEAGGGHAKTYEIPEILAYIAHSMSFYKNLFPAVVSIVQATQMAMKIAIAFKLTRFNDTFEICGLGQEKPQFFGLLINYCITLSTFGLVSRALKLYVGRRFCRSGDRLVSSLSNGRHLARALCKMDSVDRSCPVADPLYVLLYCPRPPLDQRLRYLNSVLHINHN